VNWNWEDIVVFGLVMAFVSFERWLGKAYPKPLIELTIGENTYRAESVADIDRLISMWTANETDGSREASPEAKTQ